MPMWQYQLPASLPTRPVWAARNITSMMLLAVCVIEITYFPKQAAPSVRRMWAITCSTRSVCWVRSDSRAVS